jgi:hypothetical protein
VIENVRCAKRLRTRVERRVNGAKWSMRERVDTSNGRGLDWPGRRKRGSRGRTKEERRGGGARRGRGEEGEERRRRSRGDGGEKEREERGRGGGGGGAVKAS